MLIYHYSSISLSGSREALQNLPIGSREVLQEPSDREPGGFAKTSLYSVATPYAPAAADPAAPVRMNKCDE